MVLWTAVEAARNAAIELASGGGLPGAYRCLMQLLDDYRRAQRRDGTEAAARLFDEPPPDTGDVRVDAALAGLAEHLARHDGWTPPLWAFDEGRYAKPWWFVSGVRSWHAMALVRLFDELSEELVRRGTRAEIFRVGGAAMALAYDARRATRDIDAVFQPKEEVYSAASVVAARHDLPDDWLNGEVKGFLSGDDPQARLVYESQALRVDVASPGVPPGDEAACRSRAGRSGHRCALPVVWLHHRCRGSGPRGVGVPRAGDRAERFSSFSRSSSVPPPVRSI